MLREAVIEVKVVVAVEELNKNKELRTSFIANRLLKMLSRCKACELGYLLSVTRLITIGHGDYKYGPKFIIFPVEFCCRIFKPVDGEIMTGIVHRITGSGVFLKSGPMNIIYLASLTMPNYNYIAGENPAFIREEDSSKIEIGVVIRYMVLAVRWVQDRHREFEVLASIIGDGLGPVSLNGLDGMDL